MARSVDDEHLSLEILNCTAEALKSSVPHRKVRFTPDCVFFSASDTLYDEHVFQDSATPATLVAAFVEWVMFQRT